MLSLALLVGVSVALRFTGTEAANPKSSILNPQSSISPAKSVSGSVTSIVICLDWRGGQSFSWNDIAPDVQTSNAVLEIVASPDVTFTLTNEFESIITMRILVPMNPWGTAQKFFRIQEVLP